MKVVDETQWEIVCQRGFVPGTAKYQVVGEVSLFGKEKVGPVYRNETACEVASFLRKQAKPGHYYYVRRHYPAPTSQKSA